MSESKLTSWCESCGCAETHTTCRHRVFISVLTRKFTPLELLNALQQDIAAEPAFASTKARLCLSDADDGFEFSFEMPESIRRRRSLEAKRLSAEARKAGILHDLETANLVLAAVNAELAKLESGSVSSDEDEDDEDIG